MSVIMRVWQCNHEFIGVSSCEECNYVYMGVLLCVHGSVIMTMRVSSCEECNHDYMAV